jgi:hypothetical protein
MPRTMIAIVMLATSMFAFAAKADYSQLDYVKASVTNYVTGNMMGDGQNVKNELADLHLSLVDGNGHPVDLQSLKTKLAEGDCPESVVYLSSKSETGFSSRGPYVLPRDKSMMQEALSGLCDAIVNHGAGDTNIVVRTIPLPGAAR